MYYFKRVFYFCFIISCLIFSCNTSSDSLKNKTKDRSNLSPEELKIEQSIEKIENVMIELDEAMEQIKE